VQATGDQHDEIRETGFRVAELVFGNPTDFDAGNRVLDTDAGPRQLAIVAFLAGC
jgi:hypothetical protein